MAKVRGINKKDARWIKAMEVGERCGCHQRPERSFYVKGYQMPVCARCLGVDIGYLLGIILYVKFGFQKLKTFAFAGMIAMFTDWFLQAVHIKESTNVRRLLTGIVGGIGLVVVYFKVLGSCIRFFQRILK